MDLSNVGASFYHETEAIYVRTTDGDLLYVTGKKMETLANTWGTFSTALISGFENEKTIRRLEVPFRESGTILEDGTRSPISNAVVYEHWSQDKTRIIGLILKENHDVGMTQEFRDGFASLVLTISNIQALDNLLVSDVAVARRTARDIVAIFEKSLLHITKNDQWDVKGRAYFLEKVSVFTCRMAQIQFCLPAFPCKSSNPNKVMGDLPDKGEEMALKQLHEFIQQVEEIYPPGARIVIVSDGHVFSDCIGVNDDIVDKYNAELLDMNRKLSSDPKHADRIIFQSLSDLFEAGSLASSLRKDADAFEMQHFMETNLTDEAKTCRKLLLLSCQSDREALRKRINSQDNSILALYRGFSKFMLEDLEMHEFTKTLSKSQRKKLSATIAFEMIVRNQAYSNLVELIFPLHVRLSIHAHNNSGPKFGVLLLPRPKCENIAARSGGTENSIDLLHIPTPWHNCIVKFAGDDVLYTAKSKLIHQGLVDGRYKGEWIMKERYFAIEETVAKVELGVVSSYQVQAEQKVPVITVVEPMKEVGQVSSPRRRGPRRVLSSLVLSVQKRFRVTAH